MEQGRHAGDLPNLHVAQSGEATVEMFAPGLALERDGKGLFAGDGAALIVHASADDYESQPSGGAGVRIACAVLDAASPAVPKTELYRQLSEAAPQGPVERRLEIPGTVVMADGATGIGQGVERAAELEPAQHRSPTPASVLAQPRGRLRRPRNQNFKSPGTRKRTDLHHDIAHASRRRRGEYF